jgi:biotin carboxyl carrier protein
MTEFVVTFGDKKRIVVLSENSEVTLGDNKYHYEVVELSKDDFVLRIDNRVYEISAKRKDSDQYSVFINGKVIDVVVRTGLQERASSLIEQSADFKQKMEVKAPMPGMILKVKKNVGESVQKGESIIILEAMKMENDIKSPFSGSMKEVKVTENTPVEKGTILFTIE